MTKPEKTKRRKKLPEGRTVKMPDRGYQPRKAELEEEFDMPGASLKTVRSAFFRPVTAETEETE